MVPLRRSVLRWLAAALMAAGLAPAMPLQAGADDGTPGVVTTSFFVPFPTPIALHGALQQATGSIHLVVQAVPSGSAYPGDPNRIHTNLVDVEILVDPCRPVGASFFASSTPPPFTYQFPATYPLQPQDPCKGSITLLFSVPVHADGTVTPGDVRVVQFIDEGDSG